MKDDLLALLTIIGVATAIICGLLLGGFITTKALEYLVESLLR